MAKTYQSNQYGTVFIGDKSIPPDPGNTDYARMLEEVGKGEAEVAEAAEPAELDSLAAQRAEQRQRLADLLGVKLEDLAVGQ